MHTGTLNVRDIFGQERRHVVPLFQRPYVWSEEEQWQPLWDDLLTIAERLLRAQPTRPHFLGAIVLDQIRKPTGHIEVRLVIDGQQRLTTIQLLLIAFRDVCEGLGIDDHRRALEKLTVNEDPLSKDPDETYKVWPTNADQQNFRQVMRARGPLTLCQRFGHTHEVSRLGHPLLDGYLFFHDRVLDWLHHDAPDFDERLSALYTAIREYLRLVIIDLGEEDDAQLIFETLNARGTPLLPSDLVKNHLFHRAQTLGKALDPLYAKYWKSFDDDANYWREMLGRGHARRARIDTFLQFYLTLQLRDDVPAGHLYTAFRDQVVGAADRDPEQHLDSLSRSARVYRSFDHQPEGSREQLFFARLQALNLTSAHPFLMDLFVLLKDDHAQLLAILEDVESFLVRRMVCQLNTRGYNRLFIDMLVALHGEGGTLAERVRAFLLSSQAESARWPSDTEFRTSWTSVPIFRVLAQARVRMLLEGLERRIRQAKSEDLRFGEKLTIEHLLPQKWQAHWPLPPEGLPAQAAAEREELLHTMGNLTLLTKKLNPSISNGPWSQKQQEILKYSALALNRDLGETGDWNEGTIRQRSDALFEIARREWPMPQA